MKAYYRGFTLIELVMVLVIVGILSAYLVTLYPKGYMELDGQVQQLASDIRYIQYLAMTQSQSLRINFSTNNYSFTQADGSTPVLHPAFNSHIINLSAGTTLSTTNIPNNYLLFDAMGTPYTASGVLLSSSASLQVTYQASSKIISIAPQTGRVSL